MCGITGSWNLSGLRNIDVITQDMACRLTHRGPDDLGTWIDKESGIGLGHSRLSIIDLSAGGHQPMVSACGRYVLVFNGEIYNHQSLRLEVEGAGEAVSWRGHSDTESMLAAFSKWGVETSLSRLNGMFAFAVWDRQERRLILGRDRLGEKPLYFGRVGGAFLFSSELKALCVHPSWVGEVDKEALTLYLRHNYVPAPRSIYKGMYKLLPGHYVEIEDSGKIIGDQKCYWDIRKVACNGVIDRVTETGSELVDRLETQLRRSVLSRMEADVPLGAFLSGGVDSSTVVALMQAQSNKPVRTFSIGFDDGAFNEAVYAKKVASHLGTNHSELYVTGKDAIDIIPDVPAMWDEPFADSSQLPTFLVSQMAKEHVSVVLSGDGGDELFGGYNRYVLGRKIWSSMKPFPPSFRKMAATILRSRFTNELLSASRILPSRYRPMNLTDRLPKVAAILEVNSSEDMYRRLISCWMDPAQIVVDGREPETTCSDKKYWPKIDDFTEQMMWLDQVSYLPDDILTKLDRASMAVGLETRVPLLDHELVELSWKIPLSEKIKGNKGKCLLKNVLYRYVPEVLIERPKHGFGVPIGPWLRGPLREWGETLLSYERLHGEGNFHPEPIRKIWNEFLKGEGHWHHMLWNILMFQAWRQAW